MHRCVKSALDPAKVDVAIFPDFAKFKIHSTLNSKYASIISYSTIEGQTWSVRHQLRHLEHLRIK
jgi:hypothetical protein